MTAALCLRQSNVPGNRLFQAGLSQCPLVRGLHFRQRRYDRRPDSPVDFLCILFGGGCDFNTAGGGRHQVKTALFARKKEVIGRRRHLLGLAIRVGASNSGCLDDVEGGAGEKIAAAPLRIASDDEVAQVGDFRRFVFWQDRYREQSIGDFPHRITINTLGDVIGLHARGVGNLCFGYNTCSRAPQLLFERRDHRLGQTRGRSATSARRKLPRGFLSLFHSA